MIRVLAPVRTPKTFWQSIKSVFRRWILPVIAVVAVIALVVLAVVFAPAIAALVIPRVVQPRPRHVRFG